MYPTRKTHSASTAPHEQRQQQHQRHQKWEQRYRRERQMLKDAEDAASAYAYLANTLGLRARNLPSARHAKMAIDSLQIAIAAHRLAADLFAELESEVAA